MHQQTVRIVLYSSLAIVFLAFVWGFTQIPNQSQMANQALRESLDQELIVLNGAVHSSVEAMKYRLLDVLKAEGNDHSTRTFQDSPFFAATLLEWDKAQWKTLWYSVKSKTDLQSTTISSMLASWPLSKVDANNVYLAKVADIDGQSYFALLVAVRRPNQIPMIGIGIFPAQQFGLSFSAEEGREIRVFNDQGFALALNQSQYLGASLKGIHMPEAILDSDEVSLRQEWKGDHGVKKIGLASRITDSNLFVAIETKAAGQAFNFQAWFYLLLCMSGAIALNWVLFSSLLNPLLGQLNLSEEASEQMRRELANRTTEIKAPAATPAMVPTHVRIETPVPSPQAMNSPALGNLDFQEPAIEMKVANEGVTSLHKIISAALRTYDSRIRELGIHLKISGLDEISVNADALQLQTAIEETIKNAVEAMENSPVRELTISALNGAGKVYLTIEDTGSGIEESALGKVFDPFFSTKDTEGVARGLGLNVVRRVIEELSGSIKLISPRGPELAGTRVEFEWPNRSKTSETTKPEAKETDADVRFSLDDIEEEILDLGFSKVPVQEWPEVAIRKPIVRNLD